MPDFDLDSALCAPYTDARFSGYTDSKVFWVKPEGEDWVPVAALSCEGDGDAWPDRVCVDSFYVHAAAGAPLTQTAAEQMHHMRTEAGEEGFEGWRERLLEFWQDNRRLFTVPRRAVAPPYDPMLS